MAKDAVLGTNLVDELAPMVADLRADLHAEFGVRQFRVYLVRRRWSGAERGEGTVTQLSEHELTPSPLVEFKDDIRLTVGGVHESTDVVLTEVDLRYTEGELTGQPLLRNEEFLYRLDDGHGQKIKRTWYVIVGTPHTDRIKDIGWTVMLHQVEADC